MEAVLSLRNTRAFGAELVMPMNAIDLGVDEMEYVDGGTFDLRYSAKNGSIYLAGMAAAWEMLAGGYSFAAAASAAPTAGVGTLVAGLGGAYCAFVAACYIGAYNSCEDIRLDYGGNTTVRIRVYTIGPVVTGVNCIKV